MNNKELGSSFEMTMCEILAKHGYWVHFITPDARGAQPFDIVAAKDTTAYAVECKTLNFRRRFFTTDRLEDNQILSFTRWMRSGNNDPIIAVQHVSNIVSFTYLELIQSGGRIDMQEAATGPHIVVNDYKIFGILKDMLI